MKDTTSPPHEILVVGAGMAAHRFVERLLRDPGAAVRVTVIGDEDMARTTDPLSWVSSPAGRSRISSSTERCSATTVCG